MNGSLAGSKNGKWKGGRHITYDGYVKVCIPYNDPFVSMIKGHDFCILEHRYIIAKHLKRCLESWEVVHHINGIKTDNRLENLELINSSGHITINKLMREIKKLREENRELKVHSPCNVH